jgi:hypothetical protein
MSNTVAKTQDTTFIAANLFRGFVAKFIEVWKYSLYLLECSNDETQQFVFKTWAKSTLGGVRARMDGRNVFRFALWLRHGDGSSSDKKAAMTSISLSPAVGCLHYDSQIPLTIVANAWGTKCSRDSTQS